MPHTATRPQCGPQTGEGGLTIRRATSAMAGGAKFHDSCHSVNGHSNGNMVSVASTATRPGGSDLGNPLETNLL